jgi:tetratricopeptide (TPR) repeat protein
MSTAYRVCLLTLTLSLPFLVLGREDAASLGRQALARRQYDKAIAYFSKAIAANPEDAASHHGLVDAYAHKGQYDEAFADLNELIRLDPDDALAYHKRGIAYLCKQQYANAVADLTTAIRLDSGSAQTFGGRADAYSQLGDHDKSLSE